MNIPESLSIFLYDKVNKKPSKKVIIKRYLSGGRPGIVIIPFYILNAKFVYFVKHNFTKY